MNYSTSELKDQMRKLNELNGDLSYRFFIIAKMLDAEASLRLKDAGIGLTSYRMLQVIAIFEEITVSDLARIVMIDRAQISRVASEMTRQGLITSKGDKSNKLKKLLMLTDKGQERHAALMSAFGDRQDLVENQGSAEEMEVLWTVTDRILSALSKRLEMID